MSRIKLVESCDQTKKAVDHILSHEAPVIGVTIKKNYTTGQLVLVQVATSSGRVYIFDIKDVTNKNIMINGGLHRLLQSAEVTKVMHDCRKDSAALLKQFGIHLRSVFDTQVAYSLVLEKQGLQGRMISLYHLAKKCSVNQSDVCFPEEPSDCSVFWSQRPLPKDLLKTLSAEVAALCLMLHGKLSAHIENWKVMSDQCQAYTQALIKPKKGKKQNYATPRRTDVPTLQFSKDQAMLIKQSHAEGVSAI
ncbi:piRNA biogenesis protein EXD1-like [Lineus longissimus]|uniref:piRNA biogenesis protein EXD1-like n=1 Tax=Lineus longissimus TaxID=88925 RepID=UPI002B4DB15C